MSSEARDAGFLWDMLRAAESARRFVAGRAYADFERDELLQAAVERKIEIIGEAARNVSRAFQDSHPEIPWQPIVAQRHVLAHEYGEIRYEKLWRVATVRIPELIEALRPLVPPSPQS